MVIDWALGFALGVFTTFFLMVVFDVRPFRGRRARSTDPFQGAIARRLSSGPSIVAVGGGTGLSTLLKGMKAFTRNITAVVAVTDEGGSSGRLRTEWGVLPPGDVRNCMVALAENDNSLKRLLDFRFDRGELAGHSLGNLLLLAVSELCGDFRLAVEQMNHLLAIRGKVLPVTTEAIALVGTTEDGERVRGELDISRHGRHLKEIWVEPQNARPLDDVLEAVDGAEMILLGPGSLFTSVIPNLLLPDFANRLRESHAPKAYICNLMTQPEETEGMNVLQHLEWVAAALGSIPDYIIVNSDPIPDDIVCAYRRDGAEPLYLDRHQRSALRRLGCTCIEVPMMRVTESNLLRHDSQKLAAVLFRLCRELGEPD
ncbi:gluconeogenesis factor YvcK family protein [Fretibacterium sp. OH1220_COT-178]|uniref:gluconeogenesis factor YvcK family protein n=1 Tax=Fretibacterium sp. OH1220_COT-178 TaxID=2491047 RepID=UPI000F5EBB03|nr:gluconeogenesis factor YvcK family protein [Fretibacterium sp. OH1220_COT-178]RRD65627.1 YvcK family protein [Fretibacterium sp. OH1220_COT-178]